MRQARMFLACLAASVLAACSTDPITAPDALPPEAPHQNTVSCDGSLVTVVRSDGTVVLECVVDTRGQFGSGNGG
jgi:hypothetical protein